MGRDFVKIVFVVAIAVVSGINVLNACKSAGLSDVAMANVEALAEGEEPSWWDFFNNYIVEERIPVNTTTCMGGKISYKGITLSIGSCTQYTYVIYHHCYDGGSADQCTSSGPHAYI